MKTDSNRHVRFNYRVTYIIIPIYDYNNGPRDVLLLIKKKKKKTSIASRTMPRPVGYDFFSFSILLRDDWIRK